MNAEKCVKYLELAFVEQSLILCVVTAGSVVFGKLFQEGREPVHQTNL